MGSVYAWVATIIALTGTVLNCKKKKACFVLWTITNSMWLLWDVNNGTLSRGFLDVVQLLLAVYGIYEWNKDDEE